MALIATFVYFYFKTLTERTTAKLARMGEPAKICSMTFFATVLKSIPASTANHVSRPLAGGGGSIESSISIDRFQ